jgi:hypothetical protein
MGSSGESSIYISQDYFENYAGRGKPYKEVWQEHSYAEECCDFFEALENCQIKSLCVLGAATGEVLKLFHKRMGIVPRGCEISPWAHSQIPASFRKHIQCADMLNYVSSVVRQGKSFDLVFANSLIYLDEKYLDKFLVELKKVTRFLHFQSSFKESHCPDPFRKILKSYTWWNQKFKKFGFREFRISKEASYVWQIGS